MKLLSPHQLSPEDICPYLPEQFARHEFFLATELNEEELDNILQAGFRKFGIYYFRPNCRSCNSCSPIRILTNKFEPSKSQRRLIKKNQDIKINFSSVVFEEEIYELFLKHDQTRFKNKNQFTSRTDFIQTHFTVTSPSLLLKAYLDDKLICVGFLDIGKQSVSSSYYIYDPDFLKRGLGIWGAIQEIEFARSLNIPHYYLGYYLEQNNSMNYKSQFLPHEFYDWSKKEWY